MTALTKPIHRAYAVLLSEVPSERVMWAYEGQKLTAAQLLEHMAQGSATGVTYTQTLVHPACVFILGNESDELPALADIDVAVPPSAVLVEQYRKLPPDADTWKTMSKTFKAREMVELINERDESILGYLANILRVGRDFLHFAATPDDE
jgi:hypothetical protein